MTVVKVSRIAVCLSSDQDALIRHAAEVDGTGITSLGNLQGAGTVACWAYGKTLDPALEDGLRRAGHDPAARTALADLFARRDASKKHARNFLAEPSSVNNILGFR